ncbi:SDR family NAD(P)-dependent oxidoreductase [Corynebacterium canis]|uniref:SDR family NAD(P)-dependent oxidoreductase n=1 Tax=Corynebacterium canis TaxID=679663 RepID=A0A5C5URC7_9CORY|nr:SDR family NAD(P)-dependent oxidoreductase [Corynebacterium canis]TWT29021.1 SDR family NAD(P)-dependent oxidoreductase [Corynebacterium canis]WJY75246.1 putative oxidoreductase [Corynebacterium canis]
MGNIVLFGGTSDIGVELVQRLCKGKKVIVAARRPEAVHIPNVEAAVEVVPFEATDYASHRGVVKQVLEHGPIETAIVAFGILGDQQRAEHDEAHAVEIASVDYTAQVSVLTVLADELRHQAEPATLVAFSSIAGWRPRRPNYVYGSTKSGLDAFCQGLTDALHGTHIRLITVRPGFVIGSMTAGMKPAPLSVYPADVATKVAERLRRPGSATIWVPGKLRYVAGVMRLVPRPVWRRVPR